MEELVLQLVQQVIPVIVFQDMKGRIVLMVSLISHKKKTKKLNLNKI